MAMLTFDEKAKTWDSDPRRLERVREIADCIRLNTPFTKDMTAFEYGCGTGAISFFLSPYLKHITLADSSKGMLEVLNEKMRSSDVSNMTPVFLDLMKDDIPTTKFDFIYTSMTLHHISDTKKILGILNSMLVNGGLLCIVDLDREDGSFHGADFDGHKGFEHEDLKKQLKETGFRDIIFKPCCSVEREIEGKKKKFSLFLATCRKQAG